MYYYHSSGAVSYTHLDVYKRQTLRERWGDCGWKGLREKTIGGDVRARDGRHRCASHALHVTAASTLGITCISRDTLALLCPSVAWGLAICNSPSSSGSTKSHQPQLFPIVSTMDLYIWCGLLLHSVQESKGREESISRGVCWDLRCVIKHHLVLFGIQRCLKS